MKQLKELLVKIQHLIPRQGTTIIEYQGKYYRIKELG